MIISQNSRCNKLHIVAIVSFLLLSNFISAQENNGLNPSPIIFGHINTQDGLSNEFVNAIIQDRYGFIWIGTNYGLNRYDGKSFKVFRCNPKDTNTLSGNHIMSLLEDADGSIWVGTRNNGLNKYNPITQKITRYTHNDKDTNTINDGYVSQIYQDSKTRIWICLYGGGLDLFDKKSCRFIHHTWSANRPGSIAGNKVKAIHETANGKYIVGTFEAGDGIRDIPTEGHINVYDIVSNQFSPLGVHGITIKPTYRQPLRIVERLIHTIYPDGLGNIWFGSYCGVIKYQPNDDKFNCYQNDDVDKNSLSHNTVRAICELDGLLYFGTQGGGLSVLNIETGQFDKYVNNPFNASSLSNDFIRVIYKDKEDRLWIGTDGGGVNIIQPNNVDFKLYANSQLNINPSDRLEDATIRALEIDEKGVAYIGSYNGLTILNTKTNEVKHLKKKQVYAIAPSTGGKYWIGVRDKLMLFDKDDLKITDYSKIIKKNQRPIEDVPICKIIKLGDELILGYRGNPFVVASMRNISTINYNSWLADLMVPDNKGGVWCSTASSLMKNGIAYIDKEWKVKQYQHTDSDTTSISSNNISYLYIDNQQRLWVATEKGIDILDSNLDGFVHKKIENVLDGDVKAMVADKLGNMWLLTKGSLIRFDTQKNTTRKYRVNRDLPVSKIESTIIYNDYDSAIYFTANEGLVKFYPSRMQTAQNEGRIFVTEIKLFDKGLKTDTVVEHKKAYIFQHNENNLFIEFASINYDDKLPIEYSYKLQGFYDKWQNVGTNTDLNFANLPPGNYTFQVRGQSAEGLCILYSDEIFIKIDIPWWQSIWFYLACVVFILFVLWLYNRYRTNKFVEQKLKLEALVTERTMQFKQQKEQAERSERLRKGFIAKVSHELRTPVNAVSGMVDLLLKKEPKIEQLKYLEAISNSSDILSFILNDILDLSKMEAGKLQIKQAAFSIKETILKICDTLSLAANENGNIIIPIIDDQLPKIVLGDEYRLSQVILNLCSNAIKFSENGEIVVEVSTVSKTDKTVEVYFAITDTGIGIQDEKLNSLFEEYIQVHDSASNQYGGTGLGLPISKNILSLMGGDLRVISKFGTGSKFYFNLVFNVVVDETHLNKQVVDSSNLKGIRVLLVDDDEYNRIVATESLQLIADIKIDTAINGRDAFELLKIHDYDIIFMDIQMPVLNGIEATKKIRNVLPYPKSKIPIVALSGAVMELEREECLKAGMNDVLAKPFKIENLVLMVSKLINKQPFEKKYFHDYLNTPINENTILQVNLNELNEFCEGDHTRVKRYVVLYIKDAEQILSNIDILLNSSDKHKLNTMMHNFRPKALMMGMPVLAELTRIIEYNPIESNISMYIDQFKEQVNNSISDLNLLLSEMD